ncbi:hypothetical protein [Acidaminococcus sp. HCP3S3_G9_1]|uniref:hypothetical protein n=1 Tax=Acidaminococcus sp. HCP3S3_G9_1 TaxID=3438732 RepID=UPI003F939C5B
MERTLENIRNSPFAEDLEDLLTVALLILCIPFWMGRVAWKGIQRMSVKAFAQIVGMLTGLFLFGCVLAVLG